MIRITIAALLVVSAYGQRQLTPEACDKTGEGSFQRLVLNPCTEDPCELKKGTTVQMEFEYVVGKDSKTAVLDARVKTLGMYVPVPNVDTDLCKIIECPVKKGEVKKGVINVPVPKVPLKKTTLRVRVNGDQGLDGCFTTPLVLV